MSSFTITFDSSARKLSEVLAELGDPDVSLVQNGMWGAWTITITDLEVSYDNGNNWSPQNGMAYGNVTQALEMLAGQVSNAMLRTPSTTVDMRGKAAISDYVFGPLIAVS